MKRLFLVLLVSGFSFVSYGQDGAVNGCLDARRSNGNWATYWSIMLNPSISTEYKAAYEEGWRKCLESSSWQVKNGKLVNVSKSKPGKKPRPCSQDFPSGSNLGPCPGSGSSGNQ